MGVLTAERPHLRNMPHPEARRLAAVKYRDLQGDEILAAIYVFAGTVHA